MVSGFSTQTFQVCRASPRIRNVIRRFEVKCLALNT
nr:MAG TPA: hypothetical protein [Caudoviricetes sp.]